MKCEKCIMKNVECLDSEEVFIEKTKLNRKSEFIKLKCLICEEEVNTTIYTFYLW